MKNILNLIGLASYPQFIIKGLIIILAVMGQKLGTGDVVLLKKKAKN
jgi:ribose/xylose/arabinose/galactoside ABC-type transport system permease subunit